MPNGRPGDHPLTDILHYGKSSYPDDIDEQVKEISQHPEFSSVSEKVAEILWNDWPSWSNVTSDFEKVRKELRAISNRLDSAG